MSITPGWYDDPKGSGQQRYWDGEAWTTSLRDSPKAQPQQPPAFGGVNAAEMRAPGSQGEAPSVPPRPPQEATSQPSPTTNVDRGGSNQQIDPGAMRILLFVGTNLGVVTLLTLVGAVFGINPSGLFGLMMLSLVFGMGGAFISLFASKWIAKKSTGATVIEQPQNELEQWLISTVTDLANRSGIGMPEVAIFPSNAPNAFATGAKRDESLVAVSVGLLNSMSRDEVRAVLAHEVAHVANGDMITLTLIQGVVNAVVIFLSRLIANAVASAVPRGGSIVYLMVVIGLQAIFGLFATIIVMWFSRRREYSADLGAAELVGAEPMISALRRLEADPRQADLPEQMAALGIRPSSLGWLGELISSHPPIGDRITALESAN